MCGAAGCPVGFMPDAGTDLSLACRGSFAGRADGLAPLGWFAAGFAAWLCRESTFAGPVAGGYPTGLAAPFTDVV